MEAAHTADRVAYVVELAGITERFPAGLLAGSALFGYVDAVRLRAGGAAVHVIHLSIDRVRRGFAAHAPQLGTLLVLAVAPQRPRPAVRVEHRRGEGG